MFRGAHPIVKGHHEVDDWGRYSFDRSSPVAKCVNTTIYVMLAVYFANLSTYQTASLS